jgi:hypothetical protein
MKLKVSEDDLEDTIEQVEDTTEEVENLENYRRRLKPIWMILNIA